MSEQTSAPELRPLGPETWGQRFQRVRPRGLTAERLAVEVSRYVLTSTAMIARLDALDAPPPTAGRHRTRRAVAAIVCVLCGIDPAELGLSLEDIPEGIREKVLQDAKNPGPFGGPGAQYPPWDSNPEPAGFGFEFLTRAESSSAA